MRSLHRCNETTNQNSHDNREIQRANDARGDTNNPRDRQHGADVTESNGRQANESEIGDLGEHCTNAQHTDRAGLDHVGGKVEWGKASRLNGFNRPHNQPCRQAEMQISSDGTHQHRLINHRLPGDPGNQTPDTPSHQQPPAECKGHTAVDQFQRGQQSKPHGCDRNTSQQSIKPIRPDVAVTVPDHHLGQQQRNEGIQKELDANQRWEGEAGQKQQRQDQEQFQLGAALQEWTSVLRQAFLGQTAESRVQ